MTKNHHQIDSPILADRIFALDSDGRHHIRTFHQKIKHIKMPAKSVTLKNKEFIVPDLLIITKNDYQELDHDITAYFLDSDLAGGIPLFRHV